MSGNWLKPLRAACAVLEVRPDSPAFHAKISKGDILVGLHEWETVDHKSVSFVLEELKKRSARSLRFVVITPGSTPGSEPVVRDGWSELRLEDEDGGKDRKK